MKHITNIFRRYTYVLQSNIREFPIRGNPAAGKKDFESADLPGTGSDDIAQGMTQMTPGCNSDLRAHAEGELFFCLDGKGTVLIADEVIELNRYEAVYVPPNTMHQLRSDRGEHFDVLWTLTPPFGGDKLVCDLAKKAAENK